MTKLRVTLWQNIKNPVGEVREFDWDEFAVRFTERCAFDGIDKHPGWSAAEFRNNHRGRDNVMYVTALCLDYDESATIEQACQWWKGYRGILQTTKSHTSEKHSFRVVLPLARPVSAFEFDGLWVRANRHCAGSCDKQAKDPSRFWFTPGTLDGGDHRGLIWAGEPLDPDAWLAQPYSDGRPTLVQTPIQSDIEERAIRYVEKMPPAISGSGGHAAAWDAAIVLVKGFALGPDAAFGILWSHYNPRCEPAWTEKELRHKIDGAMRANVPTGYIIDRDDERYQRQPQRVPMPMDQFAANDTDGEQPGDPELATEAPKRNAAERLGIVSMAQLLSDVLRDVRGGRKAFGCPTGFDQFDQAMGGMRPGMITVMGAPTSWGKTTGAIMSSEVSIGVGKRVLFLPFEDAALMYGKRIAARRGKLNALKLRDCELSGPELVKLTHLAGEAETWPFLLNCIGKSAEWTAKALKFLFREFKYDLVIVDYLQRIRTESNRQDRRNEVTYVMAMLSDAIKEVNAAGLILSQLKRIEDRRPTLQDLKESGDIENMAEHIILGSKVAIEDSNKFEREAALLKNKDGPLPEGWLTVGFNEKTASFIETTPEVPPDYQDRDEGYFSQFDA